MDCGKFDCVGGTVLQLEDMKLRNGLHGERMLHVKKKAVDVCGGSGNGEKAKEREKER